MTKVRFGVIAILIAFATAGCRTARVAEPPNGPGFRVVTYNVNWGAPQPDLAAEIIRASGADIVCLQETTPQWEEFLRRELRRDYPFAAFRSSKNRMGGGLAFLAKTAGSEIAYIPSDTGWFDGWIMAFKTPLGRVQVLNIHLRPPVSDSGSWVSGYFTTRDDRSREIERFYERRRPELPLLVVGDFNDGQNSPVVKWLEDKGMINALPAFDLYSPTWQWRTSLVKLSRRMDHIVYSRELECCSARVIRAGASDHFPVEAVFVKPPRLQRASQPSLQTPRE
jgi:endonuclease/exonuclease/phosphatase family metal-dependent hydrolase